jgi:hypothetical protein
MHLFVLLIALGGAPSADEALAGLKPGMWQYHREVPDPSKPGQSLTLDRTECEDPAEALRRQREKLEKGGCKFGEATREGDTLTRRAECNLQGAKVKVTHRTLRAPDGYRSTIDSEFQQGDTSVTQRETVTAKRLGDCKK